MTTYLIEIHMPDVGGREVERAVRMLDAAQIRMGGAAAGARTVMVGLDRQDGRLICLVEAPGLVSARRKVRMALLPGGRIREITHPACPELPGSHPGGDIDPGVEPELVEDVVDVGLDGSLGQE